MSGQQVSIVPSELLRKFGSGAMSKGTRYSNTDMIIDYGWNARGELTGRCRGSGREIYQVTVAFTGAPSSRTVRMAMCSCPVGLNCKHAVALLLVAGRAGVRTSVPEVSWRTMLSAVLDDASPGSPAVPETRPLALHIGMTAAPRYATRMSGDTAPTLTMAPMTMGKRGRWIKTGASWSNVLDAYNRDFAPAQKAAMSALYREFVGNAYSHGAIDTLRLTGAPATIWPLLDAVVEAGVSLTVDGGLTANAVRLATGRLRYTLAAHESGARLTAAFEIDPPSSGGAEQQLSPGDVGGYLGPDARRSHGLWTVDGGTLVLAGFDPVPSPAELDAVRSDAQVLIPQEDLPEFAAQVLPRLSHVRSIEVRDAELFAPPRIEGPFVTLTLTAESAGGARLSWSTGYRVNDTTHLFDPAERVGTGYRDQAEEDALWQSVRPELSATAWVCRGWVADATAHWQRRQHREHSALIVGELGLLRSGRPLADVITDADIESLRLPVSLSEVEAAVLCVEALPELEAHPDIVVDNRLGVDYRAAPTPPSIEFFADAGESGDDGNLGNDWFGLGITVTVGPVPVPVADIIREIVSGATHMLVGDGVYFPLDTPELMKLSELLAEARALGEIESGKVHTASLNATFWEELLALGVVDEQLARWHKRMAMLADAVPPHPVDPPTELCAQLRDYQQAGFDWLNFLWDNGLGGILADDMGLGKTVQTLALIARAVAEDADASFLVIAPTSVVANWAAECRKFVPDLRTVAVTGTEAKTGLSFADQATGANLVVTSYTLLRLMFDEINEFHWSGAIFDEAQFIKNHAGKTHQCARRIDAGFKLAITGTPMENNLMELWSLLSVTAPGLFPSPTAFTDYFRKPIESHSAPERLGVLRRRIKPVMLRRTKDQVAIDLPPKQEQVLTLELSARHRKIYDTRLARERQKVLGLLGDWEKNRFQVFRSLSVLRQLSLHAMLVDDTHHGVSSAKVEYLTEQLPELIAEGHTALVFSQFTRFLHILTTHLDKVGIAYSYLDGSMNAAQRADAVARFTGGRTQVFLISLKAGGFGLNLTEADYCFVCDPWWNPAAEAQAVDRAHRLGQQRPVTVYRMVSADTIEERVVALQERKRALFDAVVDDGELFGTTISANDIRDMIG
ncbi:MULTISPECIES: DEAD/DEAH box helicase [Gordonia]|nr:DEAD/DEAH box helicase [Gordonia pseudamarae]